MTEPQLFSPVGDADYLAIGEHEIIWFKDAEAYPEEPGDICPPQWATIACGWQSGPMAQESEIGGDDLSAIAEGVIAKPLAGYPVARLISPPLPPTTEDRGAHGVAFELTTPVSDPGLPGLFRVSYVAGAAGLAYSEGIQGYQIFVTVPLGYVIVIVAYDDDVRVGAVLRPADKPQGLSMMEFLDLSIEALGIEALDHKLDLRVPS